ncbi:MAG: globin-like protein [Verrucomicrobia bacterium]|nr:globin-like protein [Verrucomicrobiota bacterium]
MNTKNSTYRGSMIWRLLVVGVLSVSLTGLVGCGTKKSAKKRDDFFTSGSRDADQRASQRMAKEQQLAGTGEGSGEKGVKKAEVTEGGTNGVVGAQVEGKLALFDRLGGEAGIKAIIDDFTPRVLQDPRVNWDRSDVKGKGVAFIRKDGPEPWTADDRAVATLKKHLVQFLVLATGGPAKYEGKDMRETHAKMRIGNPEFDAVLGDLKASLDRLKIPNKEQKELLSIVESTRPQIVTER